MKKLLLLLALLPSVSFSAFKTDWLQNTSSSITLNGTTYYWQAGPGSSGQFLTTNGAAQPIVTWGTPATGGGGGSPLEVFSNFDATRTSPTLSISIGDSMLMGVSGSTAALNVDISSVTFGLITASSVSANYITLSSVSANFLTQSSATANYLTISSSGNFLTTSSAVATYFPLVSSTTLLTISSATANFLSLSSASANFLTRSSATATYLQIASSVTFMSQSSATLNFLTLSSASATYFPIISSTTLLTTSSATANFLTLSSAAATYINRASSGTFIQNRNTLQDGSTFYVSSGTANTFNSTTANLNTLNFTTLNGSPWGAANLVPYLNGGNVLDTDPLFFYLDAFQILFAPSILGTTQMGSAYGAPVVMYDDDLSNFVGFESSGAMTTDTVYTLPNAFGAANQVWAFDGVRSFENKYVNQIMKFSTWFNAEQAKLPQSNSAVISNADALRVPMLLFDASVDESVSWSGFLTPYTTTQMSAKVWYTMASATTGNVVHNLQIACSSSTYSGDIDTIAFGAVSASTFTVPSVAGRIGIATMTVLNTNYGCRRDDMFILKYLRDANAGADTASGDLEVRKIQMFEP